MKTLKIIAFVIVVFCITACEKTNVAPQIPKGLMGTWHYNWELVQQDPNYSYFEKIPDLVNEYCFTFNSNGEFVERKNAGWCGTPPVAYRDYTGTWKLQNDSILKIDVGYWGGMEHRVWKIIQVTDSTLTIELVSSELDGALGG